MSFPNETKKLGIMNVDQFGRRFYRNTNAYLQDDVAGANISNEACTMPSVTTYDPKQTLPYISRGG